MSSMPPMKFITKCRSQIHQFTPSWRLYIRNAQSVIVICKGGSVESLFLSLKRLRGGVEHLSLEQLSLEQLSLEGIWSSYV